MWRLRKRGGHTIPQACTILTDGLPNVSMRMESCAEYADPEAGSCAEYADPEAVNAAVTSEGAADIQTAAISRRKKGTCRSQLWDLLWVRGRPNAAGHARERGRGSHLTRELRAHEQQRSDRA